MNILAALALASLFSLTTWADKKDSKNTEKTSKKKKAHAHVHGAGQAELAFEGPNGMLKLKFPAESVFGFEHAPKTEAEKKAHHDAMSLLETNINDMVKFESELKCEISKDKFSDSTVEGGGHADVEALFKLVCDKSPVGSDVEFNFQKTFPQLKKVDVVVLADSVQTQGKATKNGTKVKIKK